MGELRLSLFSQEVSVDIIVKQDEDSIAEYSVFWWDNIGNYYYEGRGLMIREAVEKAHSLTIRPAAKLGIIRRVMITDGMDYSVFEWVNDDNGGYIEWPPTTH